MADWRPPLVLAQLSAAVYDGEDAFAAGSRRPRVRPGISPMDWQRAPAGRGSLHRAAGRAGDRGGVPRDQHLSGSTGRSRLRRPPAGAVVGPQGLPERTRRRRGRGGGGSLGTRPRTPLGDRAQPRRGDGRAVYREAPAGTPVGAATRHLRPTGVRRVDDGGRPQRRPRQPVRAGDLRGRPRRPACSRVSPRRPGRSLSRRAADGVPNAGAGVGGVERGTAGRHHRLFARHRPAGTADVHRGRGAGATGRGGRAGRPRHDRREGRRGFRGSAPGRTVFCRTPATIG